MDIMVHDVQSVDVNDVREFPAEGKLKAFWSATLSINTKSDPITLKLFFEERPVGLATGTKLVTLSTVDTFTEGDIP